MVLKIISAKLKLKLGLSFEILQKYLKACFMDSVKKVGFPMGEWVLCLSKMSKFSNSGANKNNFVSNIGRREDLFF